MKQSKILMAAAALSGLMVGTAARGAATGGSGAPVVTPAVRALAQQAGVRIVNLDGATTNPIHACAGKNDCKTTGGCKTGDQGCKGKNSCKGKGGCSTTPTL